MLNFLSLNLNASCTVLFNGGFLFPIFFFCFLYTIVCVNGNVAFVNYLSSELIEQGISLKVIDYSITRSSLSIYWFLYSWGLMLILHTFCHLFLPIGLLSNLPYHISFWLFGSALGLLLCVYICCGEDLFLLPLERGLQDNFNLISSDITAVRYLYRNIVTGGVYNHGIIALFLDTLAFSSLFRGIFPLLNWLYQISYFGVRLFLVFVLHSFCLSCFGELYTICCDRCLLLFCPIGGLFGLGLFLSLLMVLYLLIQIYVYISFSVSFMFKTILSYFRLDTVSFRDVQGPSFWLVPVSLVDLIPTHYYLFLLTWLSFLVLFSRVWMSVSNYGVVYKCLSSTHKSRSVKPYMR